MYYKALVEAERIKDIVTERKIKKAAPKGRHLRIGKRGNNSAEQGISGRASWFQTRGYTSGKFKFSKKRGSITFRKTEWEETLGHSDINVFL